VPSMCGWVQGLLGERSRHRHYCRWTSLQSCWRLRDCGGSASGAECDSADEYNDKSITLHVVSLGTCNPPPARGACPLLDYESRDFPTVSYFGASAMASPRDLTYPGSLMWIPATSHDSVAEGVVETGILAEWRITMRTVRLWPVMLASLLASCSSATSLTLENPQPGAFLFVALFDLRDRSWIRERCHVAQGTAFGNVAQKPAHDLP
jgi:hypothetical protein